MSCSESFTAAHFGQSLVFEQWELLSVLSDASIFCNAHGGGICLTRRSTSATMSHAQDSPLGDRETSRRRLGGSLQRPWAYQRRPWPSCQSLWVCDRRLWATTAPLLTLLCWAIALTHAPVLGQEDSSATGEGHKGQQATESILVAARPEL